MTRRRRQGLALVQAFATSPQKLCWRGEGRGLSFWDVRPMRSDTMLNIKTVLDPRVYACVYIVCPICLPWEKEITYVQERYFYTSHIWDLTCSGMLLLRSLYLLTLKQFFVWCKCHLLSFGPDPFPGSKILSPRLNQLIQKNFRWRWSEYEVLNKVCIDRIILTRMKTVTEKDIENLTPLKDQERVIDCK